MAIAIPSVTKYITQSRKKTLVNSVDSFITAASTAVNDNEFGALSNQDVIYYIPVSNISTNSCISLEKGGTNPFGNWQEAYVAVNYDASKYSYDYFFTFYDDAGYGMRLTKSDDIKPSGDGQIINPTPVDSSNITNQLGGRAKETKVLLSGSCDVKTSVGGGVSNNGAGNGSNNGSVVTPIKKVEYVDKFPAGGSCVQVIDEFYIKNGTTYYFNCKMSQYIYVRVNGVEYGLVEALESGIVTIEEVEAAKGSKFLSKSNNVSTS